MTARSPNLPARKGRVGGLFFERAGLLTLLFLATAPGAVPDGPSCPIGGPIRPSPGVLACPERRLGPWKLPAPGFYLASFYHEPQLLSGGGRYDPWGLTAASRVYARGTRLKVTDAATGKSVNVTVNDWGPAMWTGRDIDLSLRAAIELDMLERGVIIATIGKADQ